MPTTSPDNLYYPDESTNVTPLQTVLGNMQTSNQNAFQALRAAAAPQVYVDGGWTLAPITANSPAFTGLSDSQGRTTGIKGGARKWGPLVELRFRVTKGTGTITANDQGNIGDATIATLSTDYRPAGAVYCLFDYGPGRGSGAGRIGSDGTVVITDFYPAAKIEAGYQIQIDATYFTG